ncbi:hypothetical protein HW555_013787 [Spodoptera exigua]|uniref:Ubiquinone biosynthesis protein n=1 Tax=Spodoptera exigua TaxID=7107 RepID=A0A835G2R7_SPOEX|nr:hypothetical protein HW555_013787 [Spodoptera exigua]
MSQSVDVVDLISTLLDNEKYKEALNASHEKRLTAAYKDNCWDLISVIVGKIQDDSVTIKPSLYGTCEQLLSIIIEECAPEETLLEFIELLELAKNDAQFGIILPALQQILKKKSFKRGRSLEWCFNSISSYIENIAVSEHQLEGEERLLMDSDPNIRRIIRVYSLLPPFYRYFIDEINQVDSTCNNNVHTKQIITAFLISLLGKPLIYIDMDPETNANSEARLNCSIIVKDICSLEKNILKFLVYLEASDRDSKKKPAKGNDMEEEKLPYEHEEKINMTTLSGLFYTVLSGHFQIPETAIPQVYSLEYILHTAMLSVIHLLNFPEYGPLTKALALSLKNGRRTLRPFASIAIKSSQGLSSQTQVNPEKDTKLSIPTTYTSSSDHEQEDHQYEENIKKIIFENALQFVPKNGWSVESLSAGAKAAGYPTITHGLFPNGGGDLVHYFNVRCNEQLVDAMKTWPKVDAQEKVPAKFVENAIHQRLLMIDPYKNTWPKAMAIQTLPNNVPNCLATLLSLVDDICYYSGDRSVDFNWYMRRVGVAGIYKAAELFYLTDSSQDCNATRNFIASRIRDAQLIQTALNLSPVAAAPQTLTAAFTTAKNMLGINTLK